MDSSPAYDLADLTQATTPTRHFGPDLRPTVKSKRITAITPVIPTKLPATKPGAVTKEMVIKGLGLNKKPPTNDTKHVALAAYNAT